jgi:hypothetical protein
VFLPLGWADQVAGNFAHGNDDPEHAVGHAVLPDRACAGSNPESGPAFQAGQGAVGRPVGRPMKSEILKSY